MAKVKWWEWAIPAVGATHSAINLAKGDSPADVVGDIPIVGNLARNTLFGPDTSAMDNALEDAKRSYEAYRPEAWAARMGATQNAMDMFQPVNAKLAEMYGQDAAMPLDAAFDYDYSTPAPSPSPSGTQAAKLSANAPGAPRKGRK